MSGLYAIPPGTPFADALAAGILARHGADPLGLSKVLVLLPTRRACRALREAFLRRTKGTPLLLPVLRPLGDVDADELALAVNDFDWEGGAAFDVPPAISPFSRRLLLSQLVLRRDPGMPADQALFLAGELARFLDQMQIEEVPFDKLKGIVPENLAAHWQQTLEFLRIVSEYWPAELASRGQIDPARRRSLLLDAQSDLWRKQPPTHPVIAAGSTGTVPATARLLGVIASLPDGAVVLPGLDQESDAEAWSVLDPTHPQFAMRQLLERVGATRAAVQLWPAPGVPAADPHRITLLSEAMRPAAAWREPQVAAEALRGFHMLECKGGSEEEARAVAVVLREALETPGRTAALVTPDRGLARRVAVELLRWGVEVDDSAGTPLALTTVGSFLRHTAALVAEQVAPVALLSALKHPLAAGGLAAGKFRMRVRQLERLVLRGIRPAPGFAGLAAALDALVRNAGSDGPGAAFKAKRAAVLQPWLAAIATAAAPFEAAANRTDANLADLLRAHVTFAEALASDNRRTGTAAARLWSNDDGEHAALWVEETLRAAVHAPQFEGRHYAAVVTELMSGVVVRPAYPRHPRVHIWGPLEARLQQPDVLVLGALNEGTWPPDPAADPWLSRPMRQDVGLPQPERRIGLSAHDFVQGAAAPMVVLTRATKVQGEPTVPSRWLARLEAVLAAKHLKFAPSPWLAWQATLDEPAKVEPIGAPAPTPPVAVRPRKLSVSSIETWVRDPYGLYAKKILRLDALDPIDADATAADRGRILHDAVDAFLQVAGDPLRPDALRQMLAAGEQAFGATLDRPSVRAFWWPLFQRIAVWFVANERERRTIAKLAASEGRGQVEIGTTAKFTVQARADRIDRLNDGTLAIVDYKTGSVPPAKEIAAGFAPQLPLEALIARGGGFTGVPAADVSELAHWKLNGRDDSDPISLVKDPNDVITRVEKGLLAYVAAFDDPTMPYRSRPRPDYGPRFSDYDHLARIMEWSSGKGEDETWP